MLSCKLNLYIGPDIFNGIGIRGLGEPWSWYHFPPSSLDIGHYDVSDLLTPNFCFQVCKSFSPISKDHVCEFRYFFPNAILSRVIKSALCELKIINCYWLFDSVLNEISSRAHFTGMYAQKVTSLGQTNVYYILVAFHPQT